MRLSTAFVGSLSLFVFAAATSFVAACSSDSKGGPAANSSDADADASQEGLDSGLDDGAVDEADASKDAGDPDAPEQITARFGGTNYKLTTITLADVGEDGRAALAANEGVEGGAALDLHFDPKTGTFTCAVGTTSNVTFAPTPEDVYQSSNGTGQCSIVVTAFGEVGGAIDGTYTATVQNGSAETIKGNGSFHVFRKK